ncbi:hypothetical protein AY599_04300 [Leptolyngbya valderiana BDU 20041]|nr:hypothetical protein AY599_04300 [Leptolyngbya valderiana BDU 20041]
MSEDTTRLNIERAREALARARAGEVAAAVRAPRPADLSRLQEDEKRRAGIDAHAEAFRDTVRERLGLGEYRGPGVPPSRYVGQAMSAPLCDADICAPRPLPALETAGVGRRAVTAAGDAYTELPEGYVAEETPPPPAKKRRKFLGIF